MNRRTWLATAAASGLATAARADADDLARIVDAPVLDLSAVRAPVRVASIELLRHGHHFLLRTRSADGVEAVTVPNPAKMAVTYPFFLKSVVPVFVGRDARDLEALLTDVYRHASNYKMQGIALWVGVAAVEMALLELLGRAANRPVADFFGGAVRRDIDVYFASGNRGNAPAQEIAHLRRLVAGSGVRALKFRLGGRMSRNADFPPGRTEALIPLVRREFGDAMTLSGDANSSYDAAHAVRVGRLMEDHGYVFFEEPCEFDDLWATRDVTTALTIPVAGGEQEFSLHRWKWVIANRGVDIVQPDLHYGGGFIRATQVARMAAARGLTVVPHMSGGGLGYVDVLHFASFTPNAGPFMEYKGGTDLPVTAAESSLKCAGGRVRCPAGVGFGVTVAADFLAKAKPVKL